MSNSFIVHRKLGPSVQNHLIQMPLKISSTLFYTRFFLPEDDLNARQIIQLRQKSITEIFITARTVLKASKTESKFSPLASAVHVPGDENLVL